MNLTRSTYKNLNNTPHWYVLYTKARREKKVYERLVKKNITCYLPLHKVHRKWKNRNTILDAPLFNCCLFVKIDLNNKTPILQMKGIIRFVEFNGVLAIIHESQIELVKLILKQKKEIKKIYYFTTGKNAEIISGPLKGITGVLATVKNKYIFIIRFNTIMQAISFDIEYRDIKLLK